MWAIRLCRISSNVYTSGIFPTGSNVYTGGIFPIGSSVKPQGKSQFSEMASQMVFSGTADCPEFNPNPWKADICQVRLMKISRIRMMINHHWWWLCWECWLSSQSSSQIIRGLVIYFWTMKFWMLVQFLLIVQLDGLCIVIWIYVLIINDDSSSFSIQNFILQNFAIIDDTLAMNFGKKLQYDFPKMRGGFP